MAVDDEPPALNVLQKHIESVPALSLAATCNHALEALNKLRAQPIDLLFLDIQMPKLLGTDFIRTLKNPPKVIFTTAYRKFAVEGFELNAVDYLLKPISFERFLKAVSKVMDISLPAVSGEISSDHSEYSNQIAAKYLFFRVDRKMVKVTLDEILYVESLKDYIKIVSSDNTFITKQSISSLEEMLPKSEFIRIHRSFIVARRKIASYNSEIIVVNKKELPISRMYRHEVSKKL
jgi:DNA-binding LytR/AlgR family response regulator